MALFARFWSVNRQINHRQMAIQAAFSFCNIIQYADLVNNSVLGVVIPLVTTTK